MTSEAAALTEQEREVAHAAWREWVLSPEGRAEIPGQPEVAHQEAFIAGYVAHAARLADSRPVVSEAAKAEVLRHAAKVIEVEPGPLAKNAIGGEFLVECAVKAFRNGLEELAAKYDRLSPTGDE